MRIITEQPGGVAAMSTDELSQLLNKVNRAIQVAQMQERNNVRRDLDKFSKQLCQWLHQTPSAEVPIYFVAELVQLQARNRMIDSNLTNIYRQHVTTMTREHAQMLKELPFY